MCSAANLALPKSQEACLNEIRNRSIFACMQLSKFRCIADSIRYSELTCNLSVHLPILRVANSPWICSKIVIPSWQHFLLRTWFVLHSINTTWYPFQSASQMILVTPPAPIRFMGWTWREISEQFNQGMHSFHPGKMNEPIVQGTLPSRVALDENVARAGTDVTTFDVRRSTFHCVPTLSRDT